MASCRSLILNISYFMTTYGCNRHALASWAFTFSQCPRILHRLSRLSSLSHTCICKGGERSSRTSRSFRADRTSRGQRSRRTHGAQGLQIHEIHSYCLTQTQQLDFLLLSFVTKINLFMIGQHWASWTWGTGRWPGRSTVLILHHFDCLFINLTGGKSSPKDTGHVL